MKTEEIRQKLHEYIETAEENELKAIYAIVAVETETIGNPWEDDDFVAEIERRTREMENGRAISYTWEEVQERARKSMQEAKMSK